MKRFFSLLLVFVLLVTNVCLISSCENKGSDCLIFELNEDGESCTLVGVQNCMETDLVIPEKFKGKKVTEIADNAFSGMKPLQSIKIPKTVTKIGKSAFSDCANLEKVYFTGTMLAFSKIEVSNSLRSVDEVVCSDGSLVFSFNLYGWVEKE